MKKLVSLFFIIMCGVILSACSKQTLFETLDALVSVEGYIEMSLDQNEWKQVLNDEDFDAYLAKIYPSFEFIPVTTETGKPPFYTISDTAKEEIDFGYLEIPLYFRSTTLTEVIWKSATISSLPISWKSDVDFVSAASNVEKDEEIFASLVNAMRISIEDVENDGHIVVYERAPGYHHNHVLGNGDDLFGMDLDAQGYLSYHYAKYQRYPFGVENIIVPETITAVVESKNICVLNLSGEGMMMEGMVVIRIWIEAWDPDCYPVVLKSDFSLQLSFIGK
ncbi:MAG: hypothetical protein RBT45_04750 [Acholeplasmataceae bacterium]|jgi:hypothetical protein|nr:hypothetical protein [Acholeplasmataceae bacterium]